LRWYVSRNGETAGPVEEEVLAGWIRDGVRDGMILAEGASTWISLADHWMLLAKPVASESMRSAEPPSPVPSSFAGESQGPAWWNQIAEEQDLRARSAAEEREVRARRLAEERELRERRIAAMQEVHDRRLAEEQEAQARRWAERRQRESATRQNVQMLVTKHVVVLARKKRQLVYLDDYGKPVTDDWRREVERFQKRVVLEDISDREQFKILLERDPNLVLAIVDELVEEPQGPAADEPRYHADMQGHEYESFVGGRLRLHGWQVTRTPTTGDQGVDLVAERGGIRVAIQCKRSQSAIGNSAVQEANAGAVHYECPLAAVVSDAPFTPAARRLAKTTRVALLHHEQLSSLGSASADDED
jgi:restriction system protein